MQATHKYDDIINLPRHVSKKHPAMSLYARSCQFAPFAALTGYEDAIKETARETNERIDIDDELRAILDTKLQIITENLNKNLEITFTYFIQDDKKDGGEYVTVTGIVKKINNYNGCIYLVDNTEIQIKEIIEISGEIFNFLT